jgi:hypothetical protein
MSTAKLPLTVAAAMAAGFTSIQAECPGHQTSQIPWALIAGGRERSLASIVKRLRCHRCGKPPAAVYLHRVASVSAGGQVTDDKLAIGHMGR